MCCSSRVCGALGEIFNREEEWAKCRSALCLERKFFFRAYIHRGKINLIVESSLKLCGCKFMFAPGYCLD